MISHIDFYRFHVSTIRTILINCYGVLSLIEEILYIILVRYLTVLTKHDKLFLV